MVKSLTQLDLPVARRTYLVAGLALAVIKSLGDFGLARLANVHPWAPWVPMTELSIYANVRPRHLDGYLQPMRGEFRLIPPPGGRTRREGSTWYTLRVFPDGSWSVFGDALIHRIHMRVLAHIRNGAE